MAWIRPRKRADGGTTYTVTWRDRDTGEEDTIAYRDDLHKAEQTMRLLNANDQSFEAVKSVQASAKMDGPTVHEMMGVHIEQLTGVGSYQLGRYESARQRYFKHGLGSMKVKGVKHKDVARWIQTMGAAGLSPKTISNHHGQLSAMFTTAIRHELIDRNPCLGVKLPKVYHAEDDDQPTPEDYLLIREHLNPLYLPFFDFLVATGLRFGEATALTAKDFRTLGGVPVVHVTKAWKQYADRTYYLGTPKTSAGRRTVSLDPHTMTTVAPLVSAAGDELVFRLQRGGPMRSPAVHGRIWQPAVKAAKAAGLDKHVTIHQLRHLHAAIMVEQGFDMYALQRRMGHTNIQVTMNLYAHLLPDAQFTGAKMAAKAMDKMFGNQELEA